MPARAESTLLQNTSFTFPDASNLLGNQAFFLTATSTITRIEIYMAGNTVNQSVYMCLADTFSIVNNSTGCYSSSVYITTSSTVKYWQNFNISDKTVNTGKTYYIKFYLPTGSIIYGLGGNDYAGGCWYRSGSTCYSGGRFDLDFKIYGDVIPQQVCGNSIIEPPEYCDDGTAKNGLFYYRCNKTCNGYVINFMGIELINYMATSTAINASSTVIAGVYNSAFILYVFIFSVMAMLLFLVKLFFYSDK